MQFRYYVASYNKKSKSKCGIKFDIYQLPSNLLTNVHIYDDTYTSNKLEEDDSHIVFTYTVWVW